VAICTAELPILTDCGARRRHRRCRDCAEHRIAKAPRHNLRERHLRRETRLQPHDHRSGPRLPMGRYTAGENAKTHRGQLKITATAKGHVATFMPYALEAGRPRRFP
jgi:hypothetical protein